MVVWAFPFASYIPIGCPSFPSHFSVCWEATLPFITQRVLEYFSISTGRQEIAETAAAYSPLLEEKEAPPSIIVVHRILEDIMLAKLRSLGFD